MIIISQNIINIKYYKIQKDKMSQQQKIVTWQQVGKHITPSDCWVVIEGSAYNVTDFLVQHPGGDQILIKWSGLDATEKFIQAKHTQYAISLRNARFVGKINQKQYPEGYQAKLKSFKQVQKKKIRPIVKISDPISLQIVKSHSSQQNCWIIIQNSVYDVTNYLDQHPGGISKIMQFAGRDATQAFQAVGHSVNALKKKQEYFVGTIAKNPNHVLIAVVAIALLAIIAAVATLY